MITQSSIRCVSILTARRLGALALILLPLAGAPAFAGSLGEAVSSALAVAAEQARIAAIRGEGEAVRRQAGGLVAGDPALRVKHRSDRLTDDAGANEWEAMLDVPLWMPGQRDARQSVAAALGGQADGLASLLRWEIAGRVREAVWTATLAQGRLRQAEEAFASARALAATIDKRFAAGELARVDLLLARQETLEREAEQQAAQVEVETALTQYRLLTGQTDLPEDPLERVADLETVPTDHPLLREADGTLGVARAERTRTQRDRRGNPTLSLGGTRTQDGRGADAADAVQLEISIPFGLASQSAPALAAAERLYTERTTDLHRARLEAEQALAVARVSQRGVADALAVAERRHTLAHEALDLVRRAFDLGESDLTALLQAEARAREASVALELRRLEQGQARARLNQALGIVPE